MSPVPPRWWWLPPFLAGAFPVVFLFAENLGEQLSLEPLWVPLGVVLAGAACALVAALLAGGALGAGRVKAALAATLVVLLVITYGHAWTLVGDTVGLHRNLLLAWAAIGLVGLTLIARLPSATATRAATAATVVLGILTVMNVLPIAAFGLRVLDAESPGGEATESAQPVAGDDAAPDVWYIVLDRYAGSASLEETFGFDNRPFLDALRDREFTVAERATANYLKTAFSLVSSLNMEELDWETLASEASAPDDWAPVYRRLQSPHALEQFLHERGYRYIHVGSRRGPTQMNAAADMTYLLGQTSEFSAVLVDTTLLVALEDVFPEHVPQGVQEVIPAQTEFQFEVLDRLAGAPGPNFVFAHVLLPHPPYAFNADGSRVTDAQRASRSLDEQYLEQLRFANMKMLALVDRLHEGPPDEWPVIVISADEGAFPTRYAEDEEKFAWLEATPGELVRKFSILTAISVPGADRAELEAAGFTDDITPVNLFRVVLNAAFDADLQMLPQRNWVFTDQRHIYDQVDVTDRVQR